MIAVNYAHKQISASDIDFFNKFLLHVPNKYKPLFEQLITNPYGTTNSSTTPTITSIQLCLDRIHSACSVTNSIYIHRNLNDLLNKFIMKTELHIPCQDYIMPRYNIYHPDNICHLNVCLNVLSSLFHVVHALSHVDSSHGDHQILFDCLINSYSDIDIKPTMNLTLINHLHISPSSFHEAADTFIRLINMLHELFDESLITYWDTHGSCCKNTFDKSLLCKEYVNKHKPKYLIVNAQDFNVINNVESITKPIVKYYVNDLHYILTSLIISTGNHFISAFRMSNDSDVFLIHDDMKHRYDKSYIDINNLSKSISIYCYIRVYE